MSDLSAQKRCYVNLCGRTACFRIRPRFHDIARRHRVSGYEVVGRSAPAAWELRCPVPREGPVKPHTYRTIISSMSAIALVLAIADFAFAQSDHRLPTVLVLATGGTIAGEQF